MLRIQDVSPEDSFRVMQAVESYRQDQPAHADAILSLLGDRALAAVFLVLVGIAETIDAIDQEAHRE